MSELRPGLHQIPQILGPRYLYQYLFIGERSLLVDTGMANSPAETILPYMETIGFDPAGLDMILISHADVDHMGGNGQMRAAAPDATLACHRLDAGWIGSRARILAERYGWYRQFGMDYPAEANAWLAENLGADVRIDLELSGGETFWLGDDRPLHILHLPGHSPGHLGVFDEANRALVIIDAILWRGLLDMEGALISPPPYFQIRPYLDAIDRVLALDFDHLYTGHFDPLSGEAARTWLAESKAHVERTHHVVAHVLRSADRPLTLPEVHEATNAAVGPYPVFAIELAGPVYAHLEQLVADGEAYRGERDGYPSWQATRDL